LARAKVYFNEQNCKGCELCVASCPKKLLRLSERINNQGYHPAELTDEEKCTGCGLCAVMCPDVAIAVEREVRA